LLAVGDGPFTMTLRGSLPGYVKRLRKVFKQAEADGLLVMVPINEAYTSQVTGKP
jgi:hypothetical protein